MVSVTADSNIWVSAFNSAGKPRRLIEMADAGEIGLAVSEPIIKEVLHVLRERFQWSGEALEEAESRMNGIARKVAPVEEVNVIPADQADNRIDIGMRGGEVGSRRIRRQRSTARRDMLIVKVPNFLELMAKGVGR